MEFVGLQEIWPALKGHGIVESRPERQHETHGAHGVHAQRESPAPPLEFSLDPAMHAATALLGPAEGYRRDPTCIQIEVAIDRVAATLEAVLHKLHLAPLYLVPSTNWRSVFEIVSPGLASNQHWQDIELQATVELNTRDPLVCDPGDLHLLREVVRVLLADGNAGDDGSRQCLTLLATGQPLVVRIRPKCGVRMLIGSAKVAEQIRDAALHFAVRS